MEIDHIFIFSSSNGEEADELLKFGFSEGSSRIHPGQGTTNRKFYFENFFLEVLWVSNKSEIQSEVTSKTKLWERSQFIENDYSRFGLCLVNTKSTDLLFKQSSVYQPKYFPEGFSIDIITNEQHKELPWTFRLPLRKEIKINEEPIVHVNKIRSLTKSIFETNLKNLNTQDQSVYNGFKSINFRQSNRIHLTLEFDNLEQGKEKFFQELNLTIKY